MGGLGLGLKGLPVAEKTYLFKGSILRFLHILPLKGRSFWLQVGLYKGLQTTILGVGLQSLGGSTYRV